MASHVVVVDSSFRRHTVKTTPNTYLTDVLAEACSKLGVSPEQYTLKHNGKQVDVSRTIRLSGLSGGAKLDLIQGSRSPAVVSVALQLPATGDQAGSLARLTDKFPSNTTIWQILRRFESGVAGSKPNQTVHYNFTQRATPQMIDNKGGPFAGSGRLVYEMPVVTVMSRSLASFSDLQRSLAQLGFNSGSCLLRLSYSVTDQPLEAALASISQYFDEVENSDLLSTSTAVPDNPIVAEDKSPFQSEPIVSSLEGECSSTDIPDKLSTEKPRVVIPNSAPRSTISDAVASPEPHGSPHPDSNASLPENMHSSVSANQSSSLNAGLSIFAPPTSSTPGAATASHFNEADYTPTVEHAQTHQARLAQESRNRKLLSDNEILALEAERDAALSSVMSVNVRIRFPDQSQAQKSFDRETTVQDLYQFCRGLMYLPKEEEIELRFANSKGKMEQLDEDNRHLIRDLGWKGGVLVTVVWGPNVGTEARRRPALLPEYRAQAQAMKVTPNPTSPDEGQDSPKGRILGMLTPKGKENGATRSPGEKEAKLKKLLGFGKR